MRAAELDLAEPAYAAAVALERAHPDHVDFTSGRRGVQAQARAMAGNVVLNRKWIAETYVDTPASRMLQAWVDGHPQATTALAIEQGFSILMTSWSPTLRGELSKHFSGLAFDVRPLPPGPIANAVKATIRKLPGLVKFLEREGGLVRWHCQFA